MKTSRLQKIVKRTSPTRMFVVSFVILIFIGTVLLTLPISAKSGRFTNPVDALFHGDLRRVCHGPFRV